MRFHHLNEAGNYGDAGAEAEATISKVGALASKAKAKFASAYDRAEGQIKSELEKAAEKAQKAMAGGKDKKVKVDASEMASTATNLLLDQADPSPEDLAAIDDFDANDLQHFQNTLELMDKRLALTPKLMRGVLKNGYLNAQDRTDDKISDLLSALDADDVDRIEASYFGVGNQSVIDLWTNQLTSDDINDRQDALLAWLRTTAKANERKNDAVQGKKMYYTGSGLVKVLRGQLQIVDHRLKTLRDLTRGHEKKNVKTDDQQMKESLTALRGVLKIL